MAYSVLIKNGTVFDGSGQAPYRADIGISDDRIKDIGNLADEKADTVIDATDLYVTPGFVDLTNHSDTYGTLFSTPLQESMLLQGVTTILLGNCGESLAPIVNQTSLEALERWTHTPFNADWNSVGEYFNTLARVGKGINVASLVGQETLRRNARTTEEMVYLLTQAMKEGAIGLSSNFSLVLFDEALDKETVALLSVVRKHNGLHKIHLRDEGKNFLPAVVSVLNFARRSGVRTVISHFKAVGRSAWKDCAHAIGMVERAAAEEGVDVSFDVFPYLRTGSMLVSLLPEWARVGDAATIRARLGDPELRDRIVADLQKATLHPDRILFASALEDKSIVGKTLEHVAIQLEKSPEETMLEVLKLNNLNVTIFGKTIESRNLLENVRSPASFISSDGAGYNIAFKESKDLAHPRSFGAFARFFHRIAPTAEIPPEKAIEKMSSIPAQKMGLKNRGRIQQKFIADIAIFHPEEFQDRATYQNPYQYAQGMRFALLSGKIAVQNGELTGQAAGKIITKKE